MNITKIWTPSRTRGVIGGHKIGECRLIELVATDYRVGYPRIQVVLESPDRVTHTLSLQGEEVRPMLLLCEALARQLWDEVGTREEEDGVRCVHCGSLQPGPCHPDCPGLQYVMELEEVS